MLNPVPLLSSLRFQPTGSSEVAGRPALRALGIPRPQDTRHRPAFELHELGTGADFYELEVDRQLGVLPAVTAIREKQPFHRITTLAAAFDQPIPELERRMDRLLPGGALRTLVALGAEPVATTLLTAMAG
jgi:hypothetical protein